MLKSLLFTLAPPSTGDFIEGRCLKPNLDRFKQKPMGAD